MKAQTLRRALNSICVCTLLSVGTPIRAAEAIPQFDGYYAGGLIDPQKKEIGLAFAPTRKTFERPSRPGFSAQKLLDKIANNASVIRGKLDGAKSFAQSGFFDTAEKGKAKDGLCILLFPKKELTVKISGKERTLMPFTQGTLTDLKGIEAEFGPATEKERFDLPLWKTLGFDGLVCWWGGVGVAVSSDGAVTHVLVRTAPQSEEK